MTSITKNIIALGEKSQELLDLLHEITGAKQGQAYDPSKAIMTLVLHLEKCPDSEEAYKLIGELKMTVRDEGTKSNESEAEERQ